MRKRIVFAGICLIEIIYLLVKIAAICSAGNMGSAYEAKDLIVYKGHEIQDDAGENDVLVETPSVSLKRKGIYKVTIYLRSNSGNIYSELNTSDEEKKVFLSTTWAPEHIEHHEKQYSYYVYTGIDSIPVKVSVHLFAADSSETMDVSYVNVDFANGHTLSYFLICSLFCFVLIDVLLFFIAFKAEDTKSFIQKHGSVIAVAVITILTASIPTLQFMIPTADDLTYHLMRIQSLANGLLAGEFPVKIHPTWFNGYGHALGIYYGQIFIYPLAILRILGFPLDMTYRIYVVCINTLTFCITYFCSKKMTKNRMIAISTAVFYTMALYRLMNMHKRAAVGEYSAMTFFPLIILGVAMLYEYIETEDRDKAWLYLTIGATGILNTHSLSVVMLMIVGVVFILFNLKSTLKKDVLIQCAKFVSISMLLNLFFLVPLLDYMSDIRVEMDCRDNDMARRALSFSQIFDQAYNVKGYNGDYSIVDSMPFSIGVSVLIVIVTILIIICRNRLDDRYKRILRALGVVFGVSVILTMNVFPYNYLMVKCKPIYDLLQRMEYPWRFLTLATIFATCLFMLSASMINLYYGRKVLLCFMAVILLVTIMQSKQMEDRIVHEKYGVAHYNGNDICWTFTELVPDGTDVEQLYDTEPLTSGEGVIAENMRKNGLDTTVYVKNTTPELGYVQVPLLCYPHYSAEDINGNELEIVVGDYRKLCFGVPSGYEGDVHVYFHEPLLWRISELISLVTFVLLSVYVIRSKKYERR